MFYRLTGILFVFLVLAASCIEENPDLVNPPDRTGSIRFRFLNLGLDKKAKIFEVTEGKRTASIPWSAISATDNPPADTGFVRVFNDNVLEFEQNLMVRFLRNTNYTYVGLSSHVCEDRTNCKIDTLIALRTTAAIPESNFETLLKFMNAFPDTNAKFSIRLGCPSGEMLFGPTDYKQYSINPIVVRSGEFNFSVLKTVFEDGIQKNDYLNLYTSQLAPRGQYVILAHADETGEVKISILDENDFSGNSLKTAEIVPLRTTEIRTINISSTQVSVEMKDDIEIDPNVPSLMVNEFKTIDACKSSALDSIDIISNGTIKTTISKSLEVLSRYSILVFDSANTQAGGSVLIEPLKLNVDIAGRAVVRVVNTVHDIGGVNVSIGARKEANLINHPSGFSSGITLASRLNFAGLSNPVVVTPGPAPISVFTSSEPARLLFAANTILEPDKSYLIVVSHDAENNIKLAIIDEDDENKNIDYLKQGVFFQLVNAMSDNTSVRVSISSSSTGTPILEDAELHPTNSLATVIDDNSQTIYINGIPFQADATTIQRVIMIAGGTKDALEVISDKFNPLKEDENRISRLRFVNMTTDIPITMLKKSDKDEAFIQGVERVTFSSYQPPETREQKPTFFFYDGEVPGYIARFSDVSISLGKSYCIIVYGTTGRYCFKHYDASRGIEPTCYKIIIQQEF